MSEARPLPLYGYVNTTQSTFYRTILPNNVHFLLLFDFTVTGKSALCTAISTICYGHRVKIRYLRFEWSSRVARVGALARTF